MTLIHKLTQFQVGDKVSFAHQFASVKNLIIIQIHCHNSIVLSLRLRSTPQTCARCIHQRNQKKHSGYIITHLWTSNGHFSSFSFHSQIESFLEPWWTITRPWFSALHVFFREGVTSAHLLNSATIPTLTVRQYNSPTKLGKKKIKQSSYSTVLHLQTDLG